MLKMNRLVQVGFFVVSTLVGISSGKAADFSYPELTITPRATERLDLEAKRGSSFLDHWPIQASALVTLSAGVIQSSEDQRKSAGNKAYLAGVAIGSGWLVTTAVLAAMYDPYRSALAEVSGLPQKTQREQLIRERLAEEAIDNAAALGRRLAWISFATNLAAGAVLVQNASKGGLSEVMGISTMATSVLPLIFKYRWQTVANEQRDYKKKIYSPIASTAVMAEPGTGKLAPALTLALNF